MKNLPNLFTLLNLVFGCMAIVLALQTNNISIYTADDGVSSFNIPENLPLAEKFVDLYARQLHDERIKAVVAEARRRVYAPVNK